MCFGSSIRDWGFVQLGLIDGLNIHSCFLHRLHHIS